MKNFLIIVLSTIIITLTGCATSRSLVTLDAPKVNLQAEKLTQTAVIKIVEDDRTFESRPASPSIPSLKGGLDKATSEDKARAVARKRNTYGQALGDVLLKDGTVKSVVEARIVNALNQSGYQVLPTSLENDQKADLVVSVKINKFWSWKEMGVKDGSLNTEIETTIINDKNAASNIVVDTKVTKPAHFMTKSMWMDNINFALNEYEKELITKLNNQ